MLASRLGSFEDLRVADLFAGSGALGLEALSRGAASATFVENDLDGRGDHPAQCRQARRAGPAALPARRWRLPRSDPFDLIFADPPYAAGSGSAAVAAVVEGRLARAGRLDECRDQPRRRGRSRRLASSTRAAMSAARGLRFCAALRSPSGSRRSRCRAGGRLRPPLPCRLPSPPCPRACPACRCRRW